LRNFVTALFYRRHTLHVGNVEVLTINGEDSATSS